MKGRENYIIYNNNNKNYQKEEKNVLKNILILKSF